MKVPVSFSDCSDLRIKVTLFHEIDGHMRKSGHKNIIDSLLLVLFVNINVVQPGFVTTSGILWKMW